MKLVISYYNHKSVDGLLKSYLFSTDYSFEIDDAKLLKR